MSVAATSDARRPERRCARSERADSVATSAASAIAQLRTATAQAHRDVEAHPVARRLMSSDVGVGDVTLFFLAQQRVHEAWTRACPAEVWQSTGIDRGERLADLRLDLLALGAGSNPIPALHFPSWTPESPAWCGALYVIEGSRLGGRVIARHLRSAPATCAFVPFRFLEAETARPWGSLLQHIGDQLRRSTQAEPGVDGAHQMFRLFRDAFDGVSPVHSTAEPRSDER